MGILLALLMGHVFSRITEQWMGAKHMDEMRRLGGYYEKPYASRLYYIFDMIAPLLILLCSERVYESSNYVLWGVLACSIFLRMWWVFLGGSPWTPGKAVIVGYLIEPRKKSIWLRYPEQIARLFELFCIFAIFGLVELGLVLGVVHSLLAVNSLSKWRFISWPRQLAIFRDLK